MSDKNYRYAGVCGDCCGICVYNQRNDEAEDYCEQLEAPWPAGPADDHVCDLFKIEPGSMRLSDVKQGMDLEVDYDEPYRGNVYAGPYKVHQVFAGKFTYLHNNRPVSKHPPLRGYKPVNPPYEQPTDRKADDPV